MGEYLDLGFQNIESELLSDHILAGSDYCPRLHPSRHIIPGLYETGLIDENPTFLGGGGVKTMVW
jgi:hypothetical protein